MILNKTTGRVISEEARFCRTFFSQARGLMFRKRQSLVMEFPHERKISLHMFFVFYPITILLLNQKKEIVEMKYNFRPFSLWQSKQKAAYVLELPRPVLCKIGDVLEFR